MIHDISASKNMPVAWKIDVKKHELNEVELKDLNYHIEKNNFEIKTNKEQDYNVFFRFDKDNIGVKINEKNLNRLKEFFDSDNFIENDKGTILDKDAASFVAGWFSDIAYRRNLLAADMNNDGELRGKEFKYTFTVFSEASEIVINEKTLEEELISYAIVGTYLPSMVALPEGESMDISKALDISLNDDKNLDGVITFGEYLGADGKNKIHTYIADCKSSDERIEIGNIYKIMNIDKLKEKELEELKKLAALAKLKNQGLESLTNDEKKLLKDFSINLKISEDKLKDLINNDKLGDFISYTKDFINELSETKLLDIKA
ncbi:hypothetical protein AVANS_0161 [Campylobacter sp. RM5004]|uniref:hypothetical protein n=1 Tax=Campylobacter sp. RM5004 TaxID=1660078 RepID=UPI001EFBAAEF|nr:hypothetical protein [Campylobacter sp. RM5004]ULO00813.1 hypothetical protein AVANS_0161 [Campylobacter sp. RM5004]